MIFGFEITQYTDKIIRGIIVVFFIAILFIIFNMSINFLKKKLLTKVKTKKQKTNVEIFTKLIKYIFYFLLVIIGLLSFGASWTGLGITAGLFSAALGWALQKPITGIAGWIMVVTTKPFEIGDRIIIDQVKGDVFDITLTHIYILEIGGLFPSEEKSGRVIMIPNAVLFEKNVINYTSKDEYVLDQVVPMITYESNLKKAIITSVKSAKKVLKDHITKTGQDPYVRTYTHENGIKLHIRYFAPAKRLQEYSSEITQSVLFSFDKHDDIEIAYPHNEIIFRNKKETKKNYKNRNQKLK